MKGTKETWVRHCTRRTWRFEEPLRNNPIENTLESLPVIKW